MASTRSKQQRLRNTAEGFMAALVECGFRGPVRWSNLEWELAFIQAWNSWRPASRSPRDFPTFEIGGYRSSSEPREMLWQLKRTSPFPEGWGHLLTDTPAGLTPREYLEIWADGATPEEWVDLAQDFLTIMRDRGRV